MNIKCFSVVAGGLLFASISAYADPAVSMFPSGYQDCVQSEGAVVTPSGATAESYKTASICVPVANFTGKNIQAQLTYVDGNGKTVKDMPQTIFYQNAGAFTSDKVEIERDDKSVTFTITVNVLDDSGGVGKQLYSGTTDNMVGLFCNASSCIPWNTQIYCQTAEAKQCWVKTNFVPPNSDKDKGMADS